jgi:hypothetical protein
MAIREVTKKRKGKANKRTTYASKTMAIRVMRAFFFLFVGVVIVYFYYLMEKGSLLEFYQSTNIQQGYEVMMNFLKEHPYKVTFFLLYSVIIYCVGFLVAKKKK